MQDDVEINGASYRIGKLDAFAQFHVMRRLAPVLQSFASLKEMMVAVATGGAMEALEKMGPFADAISQMKDADANYVINTCLDVCRRVQDGKLARLRTPGRMEDKGQLMFQDINMQTMLRLVIQTAAESLADFFTEPSPASPPAAKPAT